MKIKLRAAVGKLSMVFFYPTKTVTTNNTDRMKQAGVDHKCEFAKAVMHALGKKWKNENQIDCFEPRNRKDFWEGKFGVALGKDSVFYLKERILKLFILLKAIKLSLLTNLSSL